MREKIAEKWRQFTYPVTSKIPRLSRPWRVVRNLVCIVIAVCLIWLLSGGNALTAEWAFRRAETRALVGPSEILLRENVDGTANIVGKTQNGYVLWQGAKYSGLLAGWHSREMAYQERQEYVTFSVAKPGWGAAFDAEYVDLLLFCDDPAVSRGEAEITIAATGNLNGRPYDFNKTYTAEFLPAAEGVLSGRIEAETEDADSWSGMLERNRLGDIYDSTCPVTIRLYDESGELLLEKSIEYRYLRSN